MSASAPAELRRTMGVAGASFTLIGFVIGMAIFVLPGEAAAKAGPGVFLSYLLAGGLAFLSCPVAARLGSLFPISGAGYVGVSRVLSPFWGFLLVWTVILCMALGVPALGYGMADYLAHLVPSLAGDGERSWLRAGIAFLAVAGFGGANLLGVRAAVWMQAAMVVGFVAVLAVFGAFGLARMDPANMTPLLPNGWGPVVAQTIPVYFTYAGFMVIAEMGDEIVDPWRTIPVSLGIAFAVTTTLYCAVAIALPGVVPWKELDGMRAPLSEASRRFLPGWFPLAVSAAALLGGATSINAWFMTQTRDIFALARDGVFPKALAHVDRRRGEPDAAIVFAVSLASVATLVGWKQDFQSFSLMVVVALMFVQSLAALAVLLAPRRVPALVAAARFRMPLWLERAFAGSFLAVSAALLLLACFLEPVRAAIMILLIGSGGIYYAVRRRRMAAAGISLEDALRRDDERILARDREA